MCVNSRAQTRVIRALTNNPDIILANEPLSSLDDENTAEETQNLKKRPRDHEEKEEGEPPEQDG